MQLDQKEKREKLVITFLRTSLRILRLATPSMELSNGGCSVKG